MKKVISGLLVMVLMGLSVFSVGAFSDDSVDIETLDNGYYYETVISVETNSACSVMAASSTKTASKTTSMKDSGGNVLWYVKIKATFSYDGITSKCTSCSKSAKSQSSEWTIKSSSVSKSGNSATAKATATHSIGGMSTDYTRSVTIKCSANGTIS